MKTKRKREKHRKREKQKIDKRKERLKKRGKELPIEFEMRTSNVFVSEVREKSCVSTRIDDSCVIGTKKIYRLAVRYHLELYRCKL